MTCYELARPFTACLATRREARPRCELTDFCFPLLSAYEHSRLVRSRLLFETRASPLGWWACTHDQKTGGPGVSRRPIRFGEPSRIHAEAFVFLALPSGCTSDTLVASPVGADAFAWTTPLGAAEIVLLTPP